MKIQSNLNETQRVNFLKENRIEIIETIETFTSCKNEIKQVMENLLSCVSNSIFYDVCDMETREFDVIERIEILCDELGLTVNNNSDDQNYFEEQRKNQMNLLN